MAVILIHVHCLINRFLLSKMLYTNIQLGEENSKVFMLQELYTGKEARSSQSTHHNFHPF